MLIQSERPCNFHYALTRHSPILTFVMMAPLIGLSFPPLALAQDATASENAAIEEIFVTARRRAEKLQDIPEAVTVFTADTIEKAGIVSFQDFANLTPNFSFFERYRPGAVAMTMRGIPSNPGGELPVTVVVDGVNVPGLEFINQELLDIQSIEVLRGPQGALYGRGAIAGAILINTRQPGNEFEGRGKISYAEGDEFRLSAALSGPIVQDKVFFRLSAASVDRDGQIFDQGFKDDADSVEETTFSGQLKLALTENLTMDLRGRRVDGKAGGTMLEIVSDATFLDFSIFPNRDFKNMDDRTIDEWSLAIEAETNAGTFTAVSGYSNAESVFTGDADFGPLDIAQQYDQNDMKAFSQDVRFTSPDEQRLRWIVGAFYQDRDTDGDLLVDATPTSPILPPGLVLARSIVEKGSEAWALYGQVNYDLNDKLEVTAALRYDEDKRFVDDTLTEGSFISETYSQLQPKMTLAYNWTDDSLLYASYGRGFRSGGFNELRVSQAFPTAKRRYPKEVSDTYEIGLKHQLANGRVTFNAAVYHIDFDNQQFNFIDVERVARGIVSFNKAEINGVEFEIRTNPLQGLELSAALGISDAEIKDFDGTGRLDGAHSPQTHSNTFNLTAQYQRPLSSSIDLLARVDYEHRGRIFFSPVNALKVPSTDFLNARLFLQAEVFSIGVFGRNLTDEETIVDMAENAFGPGVHARFRNQPRQYGVEVSARF